MRPCSYDRSQLETFHFIINSYISVLHLIGNISFKISLFLFIFLYFLTRTMGKFLLPYSGVYEMTIIEFKRFRLVALICLHTLVAYNSGTIASNMNLQYYNPCRPRIHIHYPTLKSRSVKWCSFCM